jgi:hypothetical protein
MQQHESPGRKWTSVIAERESSSVQMRRGGKQTRNCQSLRVRERQKSTGYDGWTWLF